MKITKNIYTLLFLLLISAGSYAQGTVTGTVYDDHKGALSLATISLLRSQDSTQVKLAQADFSGNYLFPAVAPGTYYISVSMIGYVKKRSNNFVLDSTHLHVKVDDLIVLTDSKSLSQVNIVVKKPLIEQKIDRTTLNIENSILAGGSTVLEIIEKAPGVIVNHQNDEIKLKNKSGVLVMIDGRKNYLSSTDLANLLKSMTSDQVATIDIIANPSAKYDASGNAGIIDIKLKKSKLFGTNGSFSTSVGNGIVPYGPKDLWREFANLSLNHRTEKWNVYGNVNQYRSADYNETTLNRNVNFNDKTSVFDQYLTQPKVGKGVTGKFGVDFSPSEKTSIGILVDGGVVKDDINGVSNTHISGGESGVSSSLQQNSSTYAPRRYITTNFNLKRDFNKTGAGIRFDATYSGYNNKRNQDFNTNFFDADNLLTDNQTQRNSTESKIDILTGRVDLTLPLQEGLVFETGLKSDYVKTINDYGFERLLSGNWQNDPLQSNKFIYKENVNSAYVNFNKKWDKWSVQAGMRAELTHSNGNSITDSKVVDSNYLSLFPSVFVSQTIDADNSIRYSYSRRIDRPNYQQLNPFVFFQDPYTLDQGNPFLKPQFTDNFEISYTYKGLATLSLGYSNTKDYIVQLTEQNDSTKVIKAIQGNLGNFKNYSANLSFPLNIRPWWSMQNQFNLYYNKFTDMGLLGGNFYAGKLAYNINIYNAIKISDTWSAELNFAYVSPYVYGIERAIKPRYNFDAGIQKTFAEKRAKLKLNVSDIFLNSQYTGSLKYQNLDLAIYNRWVSRKATLTFSYSFGKQTVKSSKSRGTGAEDLNRRASPKL